MNQAKTPEHWRHTHVFDQGNPAAENKTRWALWLTVVMMVLEIAGGWLLNSMALLADGWHMSSHALALGLSVLAYRAARHYSSDHRFAFGTWKIEILGGYTSAIFLLGIAVWMVFQSVERLLSPSAIHYDEAIAIAGAGLLVNLACAWLLKDDHSHHHDHDHSHHHDLNLRSAYLHVLADAATSVLAIAALLGGKFWGAAWLDPVMGIVGGLLVAVWAKSLLRDTGRVLLDAEMDSPVVEEIREVIRQIPVTTEITDLHVWRVGKGKYACIVTLAASEALSADSIRQQLSVHEELVHITVEVNHLYTLG